MLPLWVMHNLQFHTIPPFDQIPKNPHSLWHNVYFFIFGGKITEIIQCTTLFSHDAQGGVYKQLNVLPWSELTVKSLSSLHLPHKSDAIIDRAETETYFGALRGIELRTLGTRVKDLNHCATLLLIVLRKIGAQS